MTRVLIMLFFTTSHLAHASNGWISFGGDLYRSDKNPWFLQNTTDVHYCVEVDPKGISVTADEVKKQILAAIAFWKNEFSTTNRPGEGVNANPVRIGTQTFQEVSCDGSQDLRFVVGASRLTPSERRYLRNVRRHLGMAVRTSYDFVQMRGRGFIFVASDQGPEKFNSALFDEKLWSEKNMLRGVLAHELGHVFGLPHMGAGLMSEAFAEKIASSSFFRYLAKMDDLPPVLKIPDRSESCTMGQDILQFLGVQGTGNVCVQITLTNPNRAENENLVYELSSGPRGNQKKLGLISFRTTEELKKQLPLDIAINVSSLIFLNPQQKVFSADQLLRFPDPKDSTGKTMVTLDYLFGAAEIRYAVTADLVLNDGTKQAVYISQGPEGHKVIAQVKGESRLIFKTDSFWFF